MAMTQVAVIILVRRGTADNKGEKKILQRSPHEIRKGLDLWMHRGGNVMQE